TAPTDVDADNNPFKLEVAGSIGPNQDAVFDLGSPAKQYRNLYLSGQTTSGGNITISNAAPEISFIETDNSNYQYNVVTDNGIFSINNFTTGGTVLSSNGTTGNVDIAGGSTGTGCTIINATGALTCSGDITTTETSGTQGWWQRIANAVSPVNITDDLLLGGNATASAKFAFLNNATGTPTASISGANNNALSLTATGVLGTTNAQTLAIGTASTGDIVLAGRNSQPNGIVFSGYGAGALQTDTSGRITSGTLPAGYGGTGFSTYNQGDLLYGNNSNTLSQLGIGAEGAVLSVSGGLPFWVSTSVINFWQRNDGAIAPLNLSDDFLLGDK